jgi:hypothetical protein
LTVPVSLSSLRAPELLNALVLCSALLVVVADRPWSVLVLLAQRLIVIAFLWFQLPLPLLMGAFVASVAGVAILAVSEARRLVARRHTRPSTRLTHLAFRAGAAVLGMLVVEGLLRSSVVGLLPRTASGALTALAVYGLLLLVLADDGAQFGMGILTLSDAGRLLYSAFALGPEVWGLWAILDVTVALAAAHLLDTAGPGGHDARRPRCSHTG